jgi:hypothetical protein
MRVVAQGSSTPGTSAPKTVRGVRLDMCTHAQSKGTRPSPTIPAARRMRTVLEERPDREAVLARFADGLSATDAELLRQLLGTDETPST